MIIVLLVIIFLFILKIGFRFSKTIGELSVYSRDLRETSKSLERIFGMLRWLIILEFNGNNVLSVSIKLNLRGI